MIRAVVLASAVAVAFAKQAPKRGIYFWEVPDYDCMPDDELGKCCDNPKGTQGSNNCSTTPETNKIAICKDMCLKNPNCGGFNMNGHLKKLGCMDELLPSTDPSVGPKGGHGQPGLNVYVLSLYPPRREYWWLMEGYDCNPDMELGNCTIDKLKKEWEAGSIDFKKKLEYVEHCKNTCDNNPFCEAFNLPNGHLKAVGCKRSYFKKLKWGQSLYYRKGHPQERNTSWTFDAKKDFQKGFDCNEGQEIGNCSQYLPPPYS